VHLWLPKPLRAPLSTGSVFNPRQLSKVSGWLRLAASTAVSSEWPTVVDVLNAGSPMTSSGVRIAAVGASANGFPTAVFDGTDVHLWPQSPAHSATTKVGIWLWYKPATVAGFQMLYNVQNGVAGSSTRRLALGANGAVVRFTGYVDNFNGRHGSTPAATLTAGAYSAIYAQYDSSRGGDANIAIYLNGVAQSLTYSNDGAGGTLGALPAASGSATIGGATDSDTPATPIANNGVIGPNIFAFNDNLTAAEITQLLNFERPT
jgi:hypothetical protein